MPPPRSKEAKERQLAGLECGKATRFGAKVQESDKREGLVVQAHNPTGEMVPDSLRVKALAMLVEGKGINAVANELQLGCHTVSAIKDRAVEHDPIFAAAWFQRNMTMKMRKFAENGVDRMINEVDEMSLGSLCVGVAIAIDKLAVLNANQGSNLEGSGVSMTFNAPVQFNDSLKGLLSAPKAQVIDAKQDAP